MSRIVPSLLVVWLTVLCPVVCGLRADVVELPGQRDNCCGSGTSQEDIPNAPSLPCKQPADVCFCSGYGVTVDPVDALAFVSAPVAIPVAIRLEPRPLSGFLHFPREVLQRPPDVERTLPLLI